MRGSGQGRLRPKARQQMKRGHHAEALGSLGRGGGLGLSLDLGFMAFVLGTAVPSAGGPASEAWQNSFISPFPAAADVG